MCYLLRAAGLQPWSRTIGPAAKALHAAFGLQCSTLAYANNSLDQSTDPAVTDL